MRTPKWPAESGRCGCRLPVVIRHWRSGKLMDARDYGHRGWPIYICPKHRR